jgi:DNA-binding MltR family transcriptional regulator
LGGHPQQSQQKLVPPLFVVACLIAHVSEHSMTTDMFNTPGSVKTLRRYWKNRIAPRDPIELAQELVNESDRAVVILAATILDDELVELLRRRMVIEPNKEQSDYIFRYDGPLGSFSSRIEIAYLFGFIDEITRSNLTDIREIRNACAHSKHAMTFSTKELTNVIKRFAAPFPTNTRNEIRMAFLAAFIVTLHVLAAVSREEAVALTKKLLPTVDISPSPSTHP